jgi:hypothetical protein
MKKVAGRGRNVHHLAESRLMMEIQRMGREQGNRNGKQKICP